MTRSNRCCRAASLWAVAACVHAGAIGRASAEARVEPASGLDLVHLAPATITIGCERGDHACFQDEPPARRVSVGGFWIGRTEVTVEAYRRCVHARACSSAVAAPRVAGQGRAEAAAWASTCNWGQRGRERHPINCVDWSQASRFCRWIGGRLPAAVEWERAAKGGAGRIFPWGDAPLTAQRANLCDRTCHAAHPELDGRPDQDDGWAGTAPVGSFPAGASEDGLEDLAGNVWEWTRTRRGRGDVEIRGAAWTVDDPRWFRSSNRGWWPASTRAPDLGFRCVVPESAPRHGSLRDGGGRAR